MFKPVSIGLSDMVLVELSMTQAYCNRYCLDHEYGGGDDSAQVQVIWTRLVFSRELRKSSAFLRSASMRGTCA